LESKKAEDYQRVVRFNESGNLVATGTTDGRVQVFKYPDLWAKLFKQFLALQSSKRALLISELLGKEY